MDQDYIEKIVTKTGIIHQPNPNHQKSMNQVRFLGVGSDHSINIGYNKSKFIADFVFKGAHKEINIARRNQFNTKHSGKSGKHKTAFTRILLPFGDEERLMQIIQDYWKMDLSGSGRSIVTKTTRTRRRTKNYTPDDNDYESALRELAAPGEKIPISIIEDHIEKIMTEKNVQLAPDWRKTKKK